MAGAGIHPYHQQWPPAAPPPPPPAAAAPPPILVDNPNRPAADEVRTIFITGLPEDVKERELQNLLRWLPGYEASQVNLKGEKPMGFALFATGHQALAAKETLQNMVFDADSKSVLHTEMAKKNLFVKRDNLDIAPRSAGIVADSNAYDPSKRMRTVGDYSHAGYSSPSPFHPPPPPVWGHHGFMAPPPPPYDPYGGYPVPPMPMPGPAPVPAPSSYVPVQKINNTVVAFFHGSPYLVVNWPYFIVLLPSSEIESMKNVILKLHMEDNTKDNPPCNTLFIGNLGENINEEELRGLFSVQPGFKQMKILRQERHTVCFIEFEDVNSASNVHHSLQGAVIPSSGSGFANCNRQFGLIRFQDLGGKRDLTTELLQIQLIKKVIIKTGMSFR
ncbi:RNA-binding protein with multiple splicing 2 [Morus notabilis]|uniref:RNA-binding protein with multiple splicing 2 n=1 Tax=Morus notabilis TaxID=981085 RepID=W9SH25_9ROSA|nr:RNA-binding protein with multiple splicing 2 [Morus notabilis]